MTREAKSRQLEEWRRALRKLEREIPAYQSRKASLRRPPKDEETPKSLACKRRRVRQAIRWRVAQARTAREGILRLETELYGEWAPKKPLDFAGMERVARINRAVSESGI